MLRFRISLSQLTLRAILSSWTSKDVKITHERTAGAARNHYIFLSKDTWPTKLVQDCYLCMEKPSTPAIIYKWIREFQIKRISIFDKHAPAGHLSTISTLTNISVMLLLPSFWNILVSHESTTKKTILSLYGQFQIHNSKPITKFLTIKSSEECFISSILGYSTKWLLSLWYHQATLLWMSGEKFQRVSQEHSANFECDLTGGNPNNIARVANKTIKNYH
jgi:hypothetical protein